MYCFGRYGRFRKHFGIVAVPVGGRCHAILFFEEFDEVRRIGECTFVADLRDRLRSRNQQHPRMHEPLPDEPLVRRHEKDPFELLFEGGQRTVALRCQFLDRNIVEDVVVHELFEILFRRVDVVQNLAAKAAFVVRDDQIDQFRHLDVFRRSFTYQKVVFLLDIVDD